LKDLKAKKNHLSYVAHKFRDITDHPAKVEHAAACQEFVQAIKDKRVEHWVNWLENIQPNEIYLANKYVTNEPSDFSCTRVPDLKILCDGSPSLAATNSAKAAALAESFFPPPPTLSSVPATFNYPKPLPDLRYFSRCQIHQAVGQLKPFKAPGPDGIPNVVLKKCIDTLVDHLHLIFRAVFELDVYHNSWLTSTTLVLRKPGKPTYDVAKAYHPIGLLNTIGKLLSTLVAADLSHLAEKHNMLPSSQFSSHSGRNTTDTMHVVAHKVKNAWHSGKVAVALFLDVQGAFPNTVHEQLIHNMKARGVPSCYIRLIAHMLTGRKTHLKFDDFISDLLDIINGTTQGCPLSMIFYAFYNAPLVMTAVHKYEASLRFVDDSMFLAIANSLAACHVIVKDMME
jgi:Reverse transcriptase (RNA-dependent DNA polymerase)